MPIIHVVLLFLLTSCSLFRGEPSLQDMDKLKLMEAIQINGEGRGRLTLKESQYLFSFESALQDNFDWILGVEIPLHGEEVMLLPDLRQERVKDKKMDSFEARLTEDFRKLKMDKTFSAQDFLQSLRSLLRFKMAQQLGLKRGCQEEADALSCRLDQEVFRVVTSKKELSIVKKMERGARLVLSGTVLSHSTFEKTNVRFYPTSQNFKDQKSILSLELFWKN